MAHEDVEIGAYEAKTRLSELLRQVEQGRSFLILRRGKPMARLVPPDPAERGGTDWAAILEAFRRIRERNPGTIDVVALVREGRDGRHR